MKSQQSRALGAITILPEGCSINDGRLLRDVRIHRFAGDRIRRAVRNDDACGCRCLKGRAVVVSPHGGAPAISFDGEPSRGLEPSVLPSDTVPLDVLMIQLYVGSEGVVAVAARARLR